MPSPEAASILNLLENGPHSAEIGRKQLTLALGGLYIASTDASTRPQLVWEAENGYARYYIPVESLHKDIRNKLTGASIGEHNVNGESKSVAPVLRVDVLDRINAKSSNAKAFIERVIIGSKATTWVRFVEGRFKDHIRFEKEEIGELDSSPRLSSQLF
jgi:hypothetical protein